MPSNEAQVAARDYVATTRLVRSLSEFNGEKVPSWEQVYTLIVAHAIDEASRFGLTIKHGDLCLPGKGPATICDVIRFLGNTADVFRETTKELLKSIE